MVAQWNQFAYEPVEHTIVIGVAGEIPAGADVADFLFVVPYNLELVGLRATAKTAPSATTELQVRRSTDNADSFSNHFGTVSLGSGERVAQSAPAPANVSTGDVLNFSVTSGGGSGANLALFIRARRL